MPLPRPRAQSASLLNGRSISRDVLYEPLATVWGTALLGPEPLPIGMCFVELPNDDPEEPEEPEEEVDLLPRPRCLRPDGSRPYRCQWRRVGGLRRVGLGVVGGEQEQGRPPGLAPAGPPVRPGVPSAGGAGDRRLRGDRRGIGQGGIGQGGIGQGGPGRAGSGSTACTIDSSEGAGPRVLA